MKFYRIFSSFFSDFLILLTNFEKGSKELLIFQNFGGEARYGQPDPYRTLT